MDQSLFKNSVIYLLDVDGIFPYSQEGSTL